MTKTAVALGFLALNFYVYNYFATKPVIPPRTSFAEFPLALGGWSCAEPEKMNEGAEKNLGVTDYLLCNFVRREPEALANVYVGYHASQVREEGGGAGENSIHPPAHCIPGSGWDIIDSRTVPLGIEGVPPGATAKRLVIAKGNSRQLVYYWYHSRGRVISEDWKKIVYVGLDRALRGRTDGSLVRFTMPIARDDEAAAEESFRDLAPRIVMQLPAHVPE